MSVYLDYNASAPIDQRVLDEMILTYQNKVENIVKLNGKDVNVLEIYNDIAKFNLLTYTNSVGNENGQWLSPLALLVGENIY